MCRYFMLYNVSPFERVLGEAGGSLMLAVINGSVTFPERDRRPGAVKQLLLTCLRPEPEQRPYVADVISQVRDLLHNQQSQTQRRNAT